VAASHGLAHPQAWNLVTSYVIDPLDHPSWDRLVNGHPRASVFHTRGWLRSLERTYGYRILALTTCDPELELTDALPFCVVDSWLTGRRIVSLPFSDHCAPLASDDGELAALVSAIQRCRGQAGCRFVELRPPDSAETANGFEQGSRYYLHTLDLRPGADALFRRFHNDCVQRKIRRAEREKLRVEQGRSNPLLADFFRLQVRTRRRLGVVPQPFAWFRNLCTCLGDDLQLRVAYKDATPVAAILTIKHRDRIVYKYGCSDDRYTSLGGTQLLFWRMIEQACNERMVELDLGRSDCDQAGLIAFKERWGAVRRELNYMRFPAGAKSIAGKPGAKGLVALMPIWVLRGAGTLLYRHAG
jgi:CelD/BcsL family acetyltransferase involved in cellulose biosynthesis